ncbi:MAG: hypothetical protein JNL67_21600 [Planctomycetaceae bacterium]|nr:hypothetical protein [Planctomycetaceae bacterium]
MKLDADRPIFPVSPGGRFRELLDVVAVAVAFFLLSFSPAPDVNEAHYWTKAKHFWDPSFCPNDMFLNSADAHWSFYVTLGQLTRWFPLESAAWGGRGIVWISMAVGWCALARCFGLRGYRAWLSAGLMVVATRWCHLSGEWVVGGAEAKGLAFAAVFFSMAAACRGRWGTAFLLAGMGAGFHVLVGGWTVLCLLLVGIRHWKMLQPRLTAAGLGIVLGGLCSLAGLLPALALSYGAPSEYVTAANTIYVQQRLPHHLVFWSFQPVQLVMFCGLLAAWLLLLSAAPRMAQPRPRNDARKILNDLILASLGLVMVGLGLSLAVLFAGLGNDSFVGLLRYYWFRTADVFLPVGFVLLACELVFDRFEFKFVGPERLWFRARIFPLFSIGIAMLCLTWEGYRVASQVIEDPRPNADRASLPQDRDRQRTQAIFDHWQSVCSWIKNHTAKDDLFLTPRSQQTFKWYAERSEVVNWKDVPQDSRSLLEWQQRGQDCAPLWSSDLGIAIQDPVAIHELAQKYEADYIVMTQYAYELQQRFGRQLPYRIVYPDSPEQRTYYVVLRVDQWQIPTPTPR